MMRSAAACVLALLILSGKAHAYSDFAETKFLQQGQFAPRIIDQHIEDETAGDESKRRLQV